MDLLKLAELQSQVKWASDLGDKLKATDNIWAAIEVLANATGSKCGSHLETLLCKELHNPKR
jgi:hypothetical protein